MFVFFFFIFYRKFIITFTERYVKNEKKQWRTEYTRKMQLALRQQTVK